MTEPMTSNVTDTALLFEGGGMRAALTSAVVAELLRERITWTSWPASRRARPTP